MTMTPEQERAKLEAATASPEEYAAQKFAPNDCIACNGTGLMLTGRFPTTIRCTVCGGPNVSGGPQSTWSDR
jgi:hypothetical protein